MPNLTKGLTSMRGTYIYLKNTWFSLPTHGVACSFLTARVEISQASHRGVNP